MAEELLDVRKKRDEPDAGEGMGSRNRRNSNMLPLSAASTACLPTAMDVTLVGKMLSFKSSQQCEDWEIFSRQC